MSSQPVHPRKKAYELYLAHTKLTDISDQTGVPLETIKGWVYGNRHIEKRFRSRAWKELRAEIEQTDYNTIVEGIRYKSWDMLCNVIDQAYQKMVNLKLEKQNLSLNEINRVLDILLKIDRLTGFLDLHKEKQPNSQATRSEMPPTEPITHEKVIKAILKDKGMLNAIKKALENV